MLHNDEAKVALHNTSPQLEGELVPYEDFFNMGNLCPREQSYNLNMGEVYMDLLYGDFALKPMTTVYPLDTKSIFVREYHYRKY